MGNWRFLLPNIKILKIVLAFNLFVGMLGASSQPSAEQTKTLTNLILKRYVHIEIIIAIQKTKLLCMTTIFIIEYFE